MRTIYTELALLGEEFLAPGLLSLSSRPLLLRNPVLILHQHRLIDVISADFGVAVSTPRYARPLATLPANSNMPKDTLKAHMPRRHGTNGRGTRPYGRAGANPLCAKFHQKRIG